jgi:vancomycin resistance protein VanJ
MRVPARIEAADPEAIPGLGGNGAGTERVSRSDPLRVFVRLLFGAAIAGLAYARLWPTDVGNDATWRVAADLAAFMLRTFQLHIGLGMIGLSLLAIRAGTRLVGGASATLGLLLLAPTLITLLPQRSISADSTHPGAAEPPLRVVSANLYARNPTPERIVKELAAADADVLALQEYTPRLHALIAPRLSRSHPHRLCEPRQDCFGVAVFSRFPLLAARSDLRLGPVANPQMRVEIETGTRRIALYNVHLLPPTSLDSVRITGREFTDLLDHLRREELPALVCGDFNFTADSAQADALRAAGWRDGLDQAGWGPKWTWPALGPLRWAPGLRIDHIYVRDGLRATSAWTGVGSGSDHRPVVVELTALERERPFGSPLPELHR